MDEFEGFLCFRFGVLSRRIARYYNNRLTQYGITLAQSFVLLYLLHHDGSNLKGIAGGVQLETPAITGLVDRLERDGLVEKKESTVDRRNLQVFLTARGREVAQECLGIAREFNEHLKQDLLAEDLAALERSLAILEQNL